MTENKNDWFEVRKKPKVVDAQGPFYEPTVVNTLEGYFEVGDEYADDGFYLIRGVEGEIYPCRKDIFEGTYEVIE